MVLDPTDLDTRFVNENDKYTDAKAVAAVEVDTSLTLGGSVKVASLSDGKLSLQSLDDGGTPGVAEGGHNWFQFLDMDGDRQGYVGIDAAGDIIIHTEIAGRNVRLFNNLDLAITKGLRVDGTDDRRIMYYSVSPNRGLRYDAKGPAGGWYGQHRFYASFNNGALVLIAVIHPNGIDIDGDIAVTGDVDGVDVSEEPTRITAEIAQAIADHVTEYH